MQLLAFLNLATLATAIDIALYHNAWCERRGTIYELCTRMEPNYCCGGRPEYWGYDKMWEAISVHDIPPVWDIQAVVHDDFHCGGRFRWKKSGGDTQVCIWHKDAEMVLRSAWYTFTPKGGRLDGDGDGGVEDVGDVGDKPCQQPDTLVLADGVAYDLTRLDEAHGKTLVCLKCGR